MGRRSSEERELLKRKASLGIEEARGILNQEVDPYEMQIPAAIRLVYLGANPDEIKTLVRHWNRGVQLLAINALGEHKELTEEERAEWQEAFRKEMSRTYPLKGFHWKRAHSGKSF
jgi:hypothetical protein